MHLTDSACAHGLTSLGVFTRDGVFHPAPEDLDFAPLEEIFREEVFRFLRKREKLSEERERLLRSWRNSGFQASATRRLPAEDREGLESLLQYMERAPVSLERLEYREDGKVLYRGKFNPSLGVDHRLTIAALRSRACIHPGRLRESYGRDAPASIEVSTSDRQGEMLEARFVSRCNRRAPPRR